MVPKKGHHQVLRALAAARAEGIPFEARLIGDGPLRGAIEADIRSLQLGECVRCLGTLDESAAAAELARADVLLHGGVVAPNGDRDGLPNVLGEAMAAGAVVVSSPHAGVTEAIESGWNGLLADPDDTEAWVRALRLVQQDDALVARLRRAARAWAEAHFNARDNSRRLLAALEGTIADAERERAPTPAGNDTPPATAPSRKRRRSRNRPRRADPAPIAAPADVSLQAGAATLITLATAEAASEASREAAPEVPDPSSIAPAPAPSSPPPSPL
jgi:hypothetical protein